MRSREELLALFEDWADRLDSLADHLGDVDLGEISQEMGDVWAQEQGKTL